MAKLSLSLFGCGYSLSKSMISYLEVFGHVTTEAVLQNTAGLATANSSAMKSLQLGQQPVCVAQ